jgi:ubiquitin C-terminal hydrolase
MYPWYAWRPITDEDNLLRPWVAGFNNLGNTCYTNATLQVLFAIREFSDFCLTPACTNSGRLGFEFNRFLSALSIGQRLSLINGRLQNALAVDAPDYLQPMPQDSIDYFHYATATIRKYLPAAPLSITEFDLRTDITCQSCRKTLSTLENRVKVLTIEPAQLIATGQLDDIDDMIARRLSFERRDWDCPACHGGRAAVSKKIVSAPRYLFVINELDVGTREPDFRYKRDLKLALDPDRLSLTGFVEAGEAVYELLAFTHHQGKWAKYGHDIAYVRHDGVWVEHNDDMMRRVEDIQKHVVFGRQYLYLYRLKAGE